MKKEQNKSTNQITEVKHKAAKLLHLEITKILAGTILLGVVLTFIAPIFFDNSALKFQLNRKAGEILGMNLQIKGDVEIGLLPAPKIIMHDVIIENFRPQSQNLDVAKVYNFYAKKAVVKLPLFNFDKEIKIAELSFEDAIIESFFDNKNSAIRDNDLIKILPKIKEQKSEEISTGEGFSAKLFPVGDFKFSGKYQEIPQIHIKNSKLILYDFFGRKKEISAIDALLKITEKKIAADASFVSDKITSKLEFYGDFKNTKDNNSFLKITSPILNFNITGNFTGENKTLSQGFLLNNFNGKINAEIAELKLFYRSYIDYNDLIAARLKYNAKPVSISSNLVMQDGEIAMENLQLKSALLAGKGAIYFTKNDKNFPIFDIDLNLENLDLDSAWSNDANAVLPPKTSAVAGDDVEKILQDNGSENDKIVSVNLSKNFRNFELDSEIKIKNVQYLNGIVSDLNLYLTASKEGKILVMPLLFQIPGKGIVRINGAIDNDEIDAKFIGKIDINGEKLGESLQWLQLQSQNLKFENLKNYTLYSDITLFSDSMLLNNFYLNLNNDGSEMLGELKIKNFAKGANASGRFQISSFDFDDYFFTAAQNIYLTPGSLLKKLLWLNNITTNGDFNLDFGRLIYKDEVFNKQNTKLKFGHGFFEIYDMSLNSKNFDLNAAIAIDISSNIPRFNLNINGKRLNHQSSQVGFVDKSGAVKQTENRNFFDEFYSLPSIEDFSGKLVIDISDLKIDKIEMKNAKLSGAIKDGNINSAKASWQFYDGDFSYDGFLGIKLRKTINGNFTINNFTINPFLNDIFSIKNVYGIANIAGNITSIAANKEEFVSDLRSEIKFNSNAPYVKGYGLSDLIRKMAYPADNRLELQNPDLILTNKNAVTSFKEASGDLQISGGKNSRVKIDLKAPLLNAILSGNINLPDNSLDLLFNAIFITGNYQQQIPINVATSVKGNFGNILYSNNIDQAKQYLGLIKSDNKEDEANRTILLPTAK